MARSTQERRIPLWMGAALALLAGGLVVPEQARAGCSHYALSRSDRVNVHTLSSLDGLFAGDEPSAPAKRPSPCAGLSCSRDPVAPPAPAPAPVRTGEWGCMIDPARSNAPEPFGPLVESDRVRPIHQGLSIDRPPRHGQVFARG